MAITTEQVLGEAVVKALLSQPENTASVRTLIQHVPKYIILTTDDLLDSRTQRKEAIWEQRVRNLKTHDKTPGNVIAEGYVEQVAKGTYRLTAAGMVYAKNKSWI